MLYPTNIKKSSFALKSLVLTLLLFSTLLKINPLNAQPKKNFSDVYVLGCLDKKALNYNEKATIQSEDKYGNLLCTYSACEDTPSDGCLYENSFSEWTDFFEKEDCNKYGGTPCVTGCLDANATNFNAEANVQLKDRHGNLLCTYTDCENTPGNGCLYKESFGPYRDKFGHDACIRFEGKPCGKFHIDILGGCIDPIAVNFDSKATQQATDQWGNILCTYNSCDDVPSTGCMYESSFASYNENFSMLDCIRHNGVPCVKGAMGCMDIKAINYDANATESAFDNYGNTLCIYNSCEDIPDTEGCIYEGAYAALREDFTAGQCSGYGGKPCTLGDDILGCTDVNASNYDPIATLQALDQWDNIICTYLSCDDIPNENGCIYEFTYAELRSDFTAADCLKYGGNPCTQDSFSTKYFDFDSTTTWLKLIGLILTFCFIIRLMRRNSTKYPINSGDKQTPEIKKTHTTLSQKECEEIMTSLISVIVKDKVYMNPEFRLNDLAKSSNISAHKVSHVINRIEGISFSDLINKYRIDEAKKMFVSEKYKSLTILAIAQEVGFNSKSAFYNAFKKHCGVSPSRFIKEHQKST